MKNPIILLVGDAGSGKDTIGKTIADNYNGITIGQADPMKRFAKKVFGFSDEQLWGSSEERNIPSEFTISSTHEKLELHGPDWVDSILEPVNKTNLHRETVKELENWYWKHVVHRGDISSKAPEVQLITPRYVLMTLGTEFVRESIDKDLWVDDALYYSRQLLGGGFGYTRDKGLCRDGKQAGYDYVVITDGRFRNEVVAVRFVGGATVRVIRAGSASQAAQKAGIQGHSSETEQWQIPHHFFDEEIGNVGTLQDLERKTHAFMSLGFDDSRSYNALKSFPSF